MPSGKTRGKLREFFRANVTKKWRLGALAVTLAAALVAAPLAVAQADTNDSSDGVSASAKPNFKVPFPKGQVWSGQTRTNHSPPPSIDFNRPDDAGDPVLASAPGTVSVVKDEGGTSYGQWVEIDHGGGWATRYAHLASFGVKAGQKVNENTQVGTVGTTGGSTGPHLHYEQLHNGSPVEIYFGKEKAFYWGTKDYKRTSGGSGNPYSPEEVCGGSFSVINQHALKAGDKTVGTVYLLYADGKNCVVTMKNEKLGTASPVAASLAVQGGEDGADSGDFEYYAGPVKKSADATCVKWGGSVGDAKFTSEWEHCG